MSALAIYIKTPFDFLICNKDYHFITKTLKYELQRNKIGENVYSNTSTSQLFYENAFGTVSIGSKSWGVRVRKLESRNENQSILSDFISSNCNVHSFIESNITLFDNNTKDIIILSDGEEIIKFDFETKTTEVITPGFYIFGQFVCNEDDYNNLYSEMKNMVEFNNLKAGKMMKIGNTYFKYENKIFGPVYRSIIRKKNAQMIFDEYMDFTISNMPKIKHLKTKISNMMIINHINDLINNYFKI